MPTRLKRVWLHLAAWGAALAIYLAIFHRLARVLALDLEALTYNQAEGLAARVDRAALDADALLLQLAALPLALLVTARAAYALLRWLRGTPDPLGALPLWARLMLFAGALAGYVFFCAPCARALAVGLSVEAFWWIQWSDNVQPTMALILGDAPAPLWGLLLASGALTLWLALLRGSAGGRARRLLRAAATTATLLTLTALAAVVGLHHAGTVSAPGLGRFEQTCGGCHIRARPLFFVKTPAQWRVTVTRMRKLERAPLSEAQAEDVIGFLAGARGFADRWTFRSRCQRCHGPVQLWEDRPAADWARITRRLARFSPYYYSAPVQKQLEAHLGRAHGDDEATFGLTAKRYREIMALADACETCHSVTRGAARVRKLKQAQLLVLLRRMNAKRPRPWSAAELTAAARTYRALVDDPALLERLFPHAEPVTGGPPW